jgi:hypothetical protein
MKKYLFGIPRTVLVVISITVVCISTCVAIYSWQQKKVVPQAKVSFEDFKTVMLEVEIHRKERLVDLDTFLHMSQEENTIIFDSRSDFRFERKHVK